MAEEERSAERADSGGGEIDVRVKTLQSVEGECELSVRVDADAPVRQLKGAIAPQSGVDADRQRLIYRGRVLNDSDTLPSWGLDDGHTVHMVQRQNNQPDEPDTSSNQHEERGARSRRHRSSRRHATNDLLGSLERSLGASNGGIFSLAVDIAPREPRNAAGGGSDGAAGPFENAPRASPDIDSIAGLNNIPQARRSRTSGRSGSRSGRNFVRALMHQSSETSNALREMLGAGARVNVDPSGIISLGALGGDDQDGEDTASSSAASTVPEAAGSEHPSSGSRSDTLGAVHSTISCDGCERSPIVGRRFKSMSRADYDLCERCYEENGGQEGYNGPFALITEALPSSSSTFERFAGPMRESRARGENFEESFLPITTTHFTNISRAMTSVLSNHSLTQRLMERARVATVFESNLVGDDRLSAQADIYQAAAAMQAHAQLLNAAAQMLPGTLLGHSSSERIVVTSAGSSNSRSASRRGDQDVAREVLQRDQQQQEQYRAPSGFESATDETEQQAQHQQQQQQHSEQQAERGALQQQQQDEAGGGDNMGRFVRHNSTTTNTRGVTRGLRISFPLGSQDTTNLAALIEGAFQQATTPEPSTTPQQQAELESQSMQQDGQQFTADESGSAPQGRGPRATRVRQGSQDASAALMQALRQLGTSNEQGNSGIDRNDASDSAGSGAHEQQERLRGALNCIDNELQSRSNGLSESSQQRLAEARAALRNVLGSTPMQEQERDTEEAENSGHETVPIWSEVDTEDFEEARSSFQDAHPSVTEIGVQTEVSELEKERSRGKKADDAHDSCDSGAGPSGLGGTSLSGPSYGGKQHATTKKKRKTMNTVSAGNSDAAQTSAHSAATSSPSHGMQAQTQGQQQPQNPLEGMMQQLMGGSAQNGGQAPDLSQMMSQVAQMPQFQQMASQMGAPPEMLQSLLGDIGGGSPSTNASGQQARQQQQMQGREQQQAQRVPSDWRNELPRERVSEWESVIERDMQQQSHEQEQPPLSETYLAGGVPLSSLYEDEADDVSA